MSKIPSARHVGFELRLDLGVGKPICSPNSAFERGWSNIIEVFLRLLGHNPVCPRLKRPVHNRSYDLKSRGKSENRLRERERERRNERSLLFQLAEKSEKVHDHRQRRTSERRADGRGFAVVSIRSKTPNTTDWSVGRSVGRTDGRR